MNEIEKYARAAASTARTPPNSPARHVAIESENAARVAAEQFAADQVWRIADLEVKCVTLKELHDAATDERDALRARMAEIEGQAVPDKWRLVPAEPTREMATAGRYRYCDEFVMDYKLMIAAAPEHKA